MKNRIGRWSIVAASVLLVAGLVIWVVWDAIPGTFYRDQEGNAHGSGTVRYQYKSGKLQLVEEYSRGKQQRSEWFRPDGTSIQVTTWTDECGEGLYVRQDGTVWSRRTYKHGIWDGPATYYNRDGTVRGTAVGKNGKYVEGYQPRQGEREE